jgi:hypothetical protein
MQVHAMAAELLLTALYMSVFSAGAIEATAPGPMPFANITRLTMMAANIVTPSTPDGEYALILNSSNVTQTNFDAVHRCVTSTTGAAGKPIEQLITLGLNIPVWTKIANQDLERFAPVAVNFLQDHDLDGMNFVRNSQLAVILACDLRSLRDVHTATRTYHRWRRIGKIM